jgi:hypothetical protein
LGLLAAIATLATALFVAGPANAAPYSNQVTCSVSTQTPAEGATIALKCSGFGANITVIIDLHSQTFHLATVTSDGSGNVNTPVKLPNGVTGPHTLTATAPSTGQSASVALNIGGAATGGTGAGNGGGGLSNTGVAVLSIGGLGLVLLVGGGLMVLAGRRRRAIV